MPVNSLMKTLINTLPQAGRVEWIGIRPSRTEAMRSLQTVAVNAVGLEGDRFRGTTKSRRQVTLIQFEHLPVIAACLHRESINPADLRRNIVVSGINLLALKNKTFQMGGSVLAYTGLCHPCSQMEQRLGEGGYNAMRGHGGITASVIQPGTVSIGDEVSYLADTEGQ